MTEAEAEEKNQKETQTLQQLFMEQLGVDEDLAAILIQEGFTTIEEVAYIPSEELLDIEEFDEEIVEQLKARAKDAILTQAIAGEAKEQEQAKKSLLAVEGMTESLAEKLNEQGIKTQENLAELAVDDLLELIDLDKETAGQLIMAARAPWFEETEENT
jgi:N utilization substance protein A